VVSAVTTRQETSGGLMTVLGRSSRLDIAQVYGTTAMARLAVGAFTRLVISIGIRLGLFQFAIHQERIVLLQNDTDGRQMRRDRGPIPLNSEA